ncbi:hypothetical protein EH243_03155 [Amphritea opalescens]|jgi:hypothetical protein|uniref:Uncharacterized protein n=1 Tax=Amphritea opalescens TaxID=2490544 RepID=A0A430KUS1_9GAMM|nr:MULTISPECIES: hypothetical protein [Amphritea]MBU2965693.1 hypothetical protein [Amphritea atlantica]MDO6417249.1 hypothetical protein [Amphritea sp. 2_MG-2023]MDX2423912.1 hypothetical protein [Amphritea sp.]RTE67216.1 hypothetical protein EH243_03155 [Amphritea opalescens]
MKPAKKQKQHPKFVEAMQKLSAMNEEERLSEENKELFDQAIAYAPLEAQPALVAIQRKYAEVH